ncbi:MAG: SDR family oxidoreductase [Haloarculaceae archaeon]
MDETVLITGCSSGIGRATARAFAERDATVYATARDVDDLADLAEAGCETATLDVTDTEDVEAVVERAVEETGRIDVVVNNAGYAQQGVIEDVPVARVRDQFDVNVYGPHRLARAVLPHMRAQESGRIVNVSSVFGRISAPGSGVYAGSKFALEAMTDALRAEVDDHGVDAVLVEPGPVDTSFEDRAEAERTDLDRSGAYEGVYGFYEDVNAIDGLGVTPEYVADVIVEASCTPKPAARYPVGTVAQAALYTRFLPDAVRDRLFGLFERLA